MSSSVVSTAAADAPFPATVESVKPSEAVLALTARTGYPICQENGQRRYGPPDNWDGPMPGRGCEVFIGKLPRDCFEDELVPLFEQFGRIYEMRLMMDFSGTNRGFCFVTYGTRSEASRAVRGGDGIELRPGRQIGVCVSVDNNRLFIGGLPRHRQRDEILGEMRRLADGVRDVIVYPDVRDKTRNRGFAFVEFESHREAAMARRKLIGSGVQLWGHTLAVDWAEPEPEMDDEVMDKVKILYVRNLMLTTSEETIEKMFSDAAKCVSVGSNSSNISNNNPVIERVKKIRDYAFVHFRERDDALRAMRRLNGANVEGSQIEVVLAKPADKARQRFTRSRSGDGQTNIAQVSGIPFLTNVGGTLVPAAPVGSNIFLVTRDGSRSQTQPLKTRSAVGATLPTRGAGGTNRSYSPYKKPPIEGRLCNYFVPTVELICPNPPPMIIQPPIKSPMQTLRELCLAHGCGEPQYTICPCMHEGNVLYGGGVTIAGIPYITNVLWPSPDEAQLSAATYALRAITEVPGMLTPGALNSPGSAICGTATPCNQFPVTEVPPPVGFAQSTLPLIINTPPAMYLPTDRAITPASGMPPMFLPGYGYGI